MKSILAANCGSSTTTAVLIEQIEGEYRLRAAGQAPSTYNTPWRDITIGLQEAIRHIEQVVGRKILSPGGWPISPQNAQQGVDAFTLVSNAGPPLQVVIVGLMEEISLTSAQRAISATYARIAQTISLNGLATTADSQIQALKEAQPEVILMVGGTDGGAEQPVIEMAQLISISLQLLNGSDLPTVLYAGNKALRPEMADILGTVAALKSVENVRPTLEIEDPTGAQIELENLYLQKKMLKLPGFDKLSHWSKYPVIPTAKSFEKLIAYMGQQNQINVLGADLGSRSTTISTQIRGQPPYSVTRSDVGVGYSLGHLLKAVPVEKIHRWLPFEITMEELYDRLLNKSLHPATIPTSYEDLLMEQAVAREALQLVTRQVQGHASNSQWNLIIGAGRTLIGTPLVAQAALLLIDGIQPWGITNLALDKNGMINMLGAIATIEPMAAVEVTARDAFFSLGTVIAPLGHGVPGKPALRVKLDYGEGEILEQEVSYGTIELLDLPLGQKARLEVRPTRHFDIGLGQPGRGAMAEVEGSLLGLIIDARGRPLRLALDDLEREEQLQQWLSALKMPYATTTDHH